MGGTGKKGSKKLASQDAQKLKELLDQVLDKCTTLPSGNAKKEWEDFLEVRSLLEKVRELEKRLTPELPDRADKWPAFFKWCLDNGAITNGITLQALPDDEYGFAAEHDIQEGDQFLGVPLGMMMTTVGARKSKLGALLRDDPIMKSMENVALSMFLILELCAGSASFWHPYISILPRSFNTVLYFTVEELQLLTGSSVLDEALKLHRSIARQYAYFHKIFRTHPLAKSLPYKDCFTYDLYRWAVSAVMTRQNAVPRAVVCGGADDACARGSGSGVAALVPLFDLCNHSDGKVLTDYDTESKHLKCYAVKDFHQGDPVTIFYGKRSNAEFLVHNGFVYADNRHDAVDIKLGISKKDPLFAAKAKLCEEHDLSLSGTFSLSLGPRPVSQDLSTFLRILVLRDAVPDDALPTDHVLTASDGNARDAAAFLATRIELLLRAFPKTAEEYEQIVNAVDASARAKMAASLRLSERKLLGSVLETVRACPLLRAAS
uniref:protein-histidine N-methyltransferase n=1 Tax=Ixodes ricinus TaxID=34613 RepID=A0A147BP83_IXORI